MCEVTAVIPNALRTVNRIPATRMPNITFLE